MNKYVVNVLLVFSVLGGLAVIYDVYRYVTDPFQALFDILIIVFLLINAVCYGWRFE